MHPLVISFFKANPRCDRIPCEFESTGMRRKKDGAEVVVCSRVGCRRHAFTKAGPKNVFAHCMHPRIGAGDAVYWAIKIISLGTIKERRACNCKVRRKVMNVALGFNAPNWFTTLMIMFGLHVANKLPWQFAKLRDELEPATCERVKCQSGGCGKPNCKKMEQEVSV